MGIYYIGSEYQIGAGFCAIALGIIILIALGAGKFDEYIEERPRDTQEYVRTEAIHDTITSVHIYEVHDTVYLPTELDLPEEEMVEDSVEVEIVSEIPLTEDEVDSLAGADEPDEADYDKWKEEADSLYGADEPDEADSLYGP